MPQDWSWGLWSLFAASGVGGGLAWWQSRRLLRRLRAQLDSARRDARTDLLTGLSNRKGFEEHLQAHAAIFRRYHAPYSVLLIDLDNFKTINDTWGHAAGDETLRRVSQLFKNSCRDCDLVARYGGDEFVVLLPQTDALGATTAAQRLRSDLAEAPLLIPGQEFQVRVSIGVGTAVPHESTENLLARIDCALYESKHAGGNRVTLSPQNAFDFAI